MTGIGVEGTGASVIQLRHAKDGSGAGTGPWAFIFTTEGYVINAWGHIPFENGLVVGVRGRTESFCGVLA